MSKNFGIHFHMEFSAFQIFWGVLLKMILLKEAAGSFMDASLRRCRSSFFQLVVVEPLTEFLPGTTMRSCLVFPRATLAHGGSYACHVHDSIQDQTASASVNVTVLG